MFRTPLRHLSVHGRRGVLRAAPTAAVSAAAGVSVVVVEGGAGAMTSGVRFYSNNSNNGSSSSSSSGTRKVRRDLSERDIAMMERELQRQAELEAQGNSNSSRESVSWSSSSASAAAAAPPPAPRNTFSKVNDNIIDETGTPRNYGARCYDKEGRPLPYPRPPPPPAPPPGTFASQRSLRRRQQQQQQQSGGDAGAGAEGGAVTAAGEAADDPEYPEPTLEDLDRSIPQVGCDFIASLVKARNLRRQHFLKRKAELRERVERLTAEATPSVDAAAALPSVGDFVARARRQVKRAQSSYIDRIQTSGTSSSSSNNTGAGGARVEGESFLSNFAASFSSAMGASAAAVAGGGKGSGGGESGLVPRGGGAAESDGDDSSSRGDGDDSPSAVATASGGLTAPAEVLATLTAEELDTLQTMRPDYADDGFILLDCRTVNEVTSWGLIEGAKVLPAHELFEAFHATPEDFFELYGFPKPLPTQRIICYCQYGPRSLMAAQMLSWMGYLRVLHLRDGYYEWAKQYNLLLRRWMLHDDESGNDMRRLAAFQAGLELQREVAPEFNYLPMQEAAQYQIDTTRSRGTLLVGDGLRAEAYAAVAELLEAAPQPLPPDELARIAGTVPTLYQIEDALNRQSGVDGSNNNNSNNNNSDTESASAEGRPRAPPRPLDEGRVQEVFNTPFNALLEQTTGLHPAADPATTAAGDEDAGRAMPFSEAQRHALDNTLRGTAASIPGLARDPRAPLPVPDPTTWGGSNSRK